MSFEVKNLNLESVVELPDAKSEILDPDFVGEVTVGFDAKDSKNLIRSIPSLETVLAKRLGVEIDSDGILPGVTNRSSVFKSLIDSYGKQCTTMQEILIARLRLDESKVVDSEYILPLRAQFLQHSAAVKAVQYSVAQRSPRGKTKRLHLIRTTTSHAKQIKPNPFYLRPPQQPYISGDPVRSITTIKAIHRGTAGTS